MLRIQKLKFLQNLSVNFHLNLQKSLSYKDSRLILINCYFSNNWCYYFIFRYILFMYIKFKTSFWSCIFLSAEKFYFHLFLVKFYIDSWNMSVVWYINMIENYDLLYFYNYLQNWIIKRSSIFMIFFWNLKEINLKFYLIFLINSN
jgi:hypothetical protein